MTFANRTRRLRHLLAPALLAPLLLSVSAKAADERETMGEDRQSENFVLLGAGALYYRSPFRGEESNVLPIPIIVVRQGPFYVDGLESGLDLSLAGDGPVSISLQPFVAARTVAGTTREKITADAGLRLVLETPVGTLSADYRHDVTDTFNGSDITLRYSVDFDLGALTVTPAVQANFIDRQTANHIYGVSNRQSEEFIKAGLPIAPYTIGRAATNLGGDITATVMLTDRLLLIGNMSGAYLGRSIRENPGLEDEFEAQALIGIGYAF